MAAARYLSLARDGATGVGAGIFSGALGVGSGLLLVPYLSFWSRLPQEQAQATSLVIVALGAAAGATRYALSDSVAWLPAIVILTGGIVGVFVGSHVVQRTADDLLRGAFGVLLIVAAIRLMLPIGSTIQSASDLQGLSPGLVSAFVACGLGMGLLSAMLGIGGGVLLVPLLLVVFGFSQQLASGTSLAVTVPIALLGATRLSRPGLTDWRIGLQFGALATLGALLGASVALSLSGSLMRVVVAVVLCALGFSMVASAVRSRHRRQRQDRSR